MAGDQVLYLSPDQMGDAVAMWHIHLIGVWQGAWDAPPDEVPPEEYVRASVK